ncbi:MAG: carboxyltransferase domain-containing protein, partial [Bacteroidota bacterium]
MMSIQTYGPSALIVSLEEKIDLEINQQIHLLNDLLLKSKQDGLLYTIPAYHTLTVVYDPQTARFSQLESRIRSLGEKLKNSSSINKHRSISLPVCYDPTLALDIEYVMEQQK